MSIKRRAHHRRPEVPLAALCGALLVIFALVAPVLANEGPTRLYDPSVSPRSGTPSTTIRFEVSYRNREGSAPASVSVVIDGTAHAMASDGGTSWKSGVTNHWSTTLPAGLHTITFAATSRDKFSDTEVGGTVTITVPPPPKATPTPTPDRTPAPTPRPTPDSTSAPTQAPDATPTAGAGASGPGTGPGGETASPTGDLGTGGIEPSTGGYPGSPDLSGGAPAGSGPVVGADFGDDAGRPTNGPISGGNDVNGAIGAGTTDGSGSGPEPGGAGSPGGGSSGSRDVVTGGPGWGTLASALETLGIKRPPAITTLPMLVGTGAVVTGAFAFAIFGKKRKDEEQPAPDEVLRANAARGHGSVPGSDVVNGVVRAATVPGPIDIEAGMPRWRRPSLIEARKADPSRSIASNHRMSFENGAATPADGRERRTIRYAVVRLLDAPDELRSTEIGQLDQGDEVQLIERSGSYWLVLCPDGRQGWLHKMTLGEVVSDAPANVFGREADDDVLTALLTARARA